MSKFEIGRHVWCNSQLMGSPLAASFEVKGIIKKDDGVYYSGNLQNWIKEEYLHESRKCFYKAYIAQAENEMNKPDTK